ncbi:hypothetical protein [Parabacteroides goldsteinii]|uniref:hypothetical protein n=1 Tax=Parabacteroides goldsteinii TaxID=328812 RepID=UPI0018A0169E|nr:hypothetical protein [Parabacteroides goldsteinii]
MNVNLSNINLSRLRLGGINLSEIKLGMPSGNRKPDPIPGLKGLIALYSGAGLTNEQMSQNPVWKDLSGNGHDLQMKNFAWNDQSGVNASDYAGAIVFDGVDDYGFCDNFPILTKEKGYTVMALRKWLTPDSKMNNEIFISNFRNLNWGTANFGAFICEVKYNNNTPKAAKTISFGKESHINLNENNPLFYQTINSYNEDKIGIGDKEWGKFLFVGCGSNLFFANVAIYSICIIDHNTIKEERELVINKWKQDFPELFSEQP